MTRRLATTHPVQTTDDGRNTV